MHNIQTNENEISYFLKLIPDLSIFDLIDVVMIEKVEKVKDTETIKIINDKLFYYDLTPTVEEYVYKAENTGFRRVLFKFSLEGANEYIKVDNTNINWCNLTLNENKNNDKNNNRSNLQYVVIIDEKNNAGGTFNFSNITQTLQNVVGVCF